MESAGSGVSQTASDGPGGSFRADRADQGSPAAADWIPWMTGDFDGVSEELEERECFSMKDMGEALAVLRGMDPPGVGARDLRDSLIQLEQRGPKRSLAFRLVKRCWRLACAQVWRGRSPVGCGTEEVAAALEIVRSLTPDPGCALRAGRQSAYSAGCGRGGARPPVNWK